MSALGVAGTPPTMRDVNSVPIAPPASHWDRLMADPCPYCGAFRMDVGYYVHLGHCDACASAEARQYVEVYAS